MIDTHAHVHDKAFDGDREAALERMRQANVHGAIVVGCDLEDSRRALSVAQRFGLWSSVGIHPHEARHAPQNIASAFAPLLAEPCVVAIGETGLDYYYDHSPRDVQRSVLCDQIALARERGLPLIFHHRDAFEDFTQLLREHFTSGMRAVVHCFTGNVDQARCYVDEFGLYLGIGGVVTFKTAQPLREAVAAVGLRRLVLETDCPYLAPVPHRGKRNEPAFVADTARKLAEVLDCSIEEVVTQTTRNAEVLFNLRFSNSP